MAVFATYAEARDSLTANKWAYTNWDTVQHRAVTATLADSSDYLDDYARIAAFLCNAAEFKAALANVSALIWACYVALPPDTRNRFTRAMGEVAVQCGFTFQNRIKVDTSGTAPIGVMLIGGDPQLGYMLRNKLFWKDGMDSRHGEHTHSLQWLAIALGARTTKSAADLYAKTADFRAAKQGDGKGERSMTMWQWTSDCFPLDMKKFATDKFTNGETLESQSFRAPQLIMDYLLLGKPQENSAEFVAAYLFGRYRNRGWLHFDTESRSVTDIQTKAIKTHGIEKRAEHGWKASPSSPDARLIRDDPAYAKQGPHETPAKKAFKAKFHGLPGMLSYHSVEG